MAAADDGGGDSGYSRVAPATDLEIDTVVKDMFDINVFAVMRMVQEFVHLLIAAEGTIVNIGSIAAIMPFAFGSAYNASKAALHSYTDTLRVELKPFKYIWPILRWSFLLRCDIV